MKSLLRSWQDVSVVKKLYLVVGVMAVLIAGELLTLGFAMQTLSAARAFVGGEGLWSKAQKDGVAALIHYAATGSEQDFELFHSFLKISKGDRRARLELEKRVPDMNAVREGFIQGEIHPDDIQPMVNLLRRFHWISYISRAIDSWREGDEGIIKLEKYADELHEAVRRRDRKPIEESLAKIRAINTVLTQVEGDFSEALGEGSRWLEKIVLGLLTIAVLMVESVGLGFAIATSRELSRGLSGLTRAADRIGAGDFENPVEVRSEDEIGKLGHAVNRMRDLLRSSYADLEAKVDERTREIGEIAKENARLYEEAKIAVAERDEFLSVGTHELKTPLTALQLNLHLLERSLQGPIDATREQKSRVYAKQGLQQAKRLRQLLDELLDLSKIRVGRLEVRKERCNLATILLDTAGMFQLEAHARGSDLTISAGRPVFMSCDPIRIGQVISNLVSNAIKYGEGKPIEVSVTEDVRDVIIRVRDHGMGISEENLGRVFERYERVSDHADIPGLGLGLYISKHIVEAHGGKISVSSRLGEGSTFEVTLSREA